MPEREGGREREGNTYYILQRAPHQKQQSERMCVFFFFQVWQQQDDWLAEIEGKTDW